MYDFHLNPYGMQFARENKQATAFQNQAAQDYMEARCLLLNYFFGGLSHGSTAVEKYLKALILFSDKTIKVRSLSHKIKELLTHSALTNYETIDTDRFMPVALRFEDHYKSRYPDNPEHRMSKSTEELKQLDDFVVSLSEALPIPAHTKRRTGIYAILDLPEDAKVIGGKVWLVTANEALATVVLRAKKLALLQAQCQT